MTRLIAFDVDSTLLAVESLDFVIAQAAARRGEGDRLAAQIHDITTAGMEGRLDFTGSLQARLDLGRLTERDVELAAAALCEQSTPGMAPLLAALRENGDRLVAVSGGFAALITPALTGLGFDPNDIHANVLRWSGAAVTGFDAANPLSRNGGKAEIIHALKTPPVPAIMVGDGMTDYEAYAAGAADHFIGFGGVVRREVVESKSEYYAASVDELAGALAEIRA